MHVAQISFFLDPQRRSPRQILNDWWPLVDAADMVARCGARVTVVQACGEQAELNVGAVRYHFVAPTRTPGAVRWARAFAGRSGIMQTEAFRRLLHDLKADVFHVHSLLSPRDTIALTAICPGTPILLQDHANRVPSWWRRPLYRRALSRAGGLAFCALPQAEPFIEAGLVPRQMPLFEIPECSSRFTPAGRDEARRITGIWGDPALLWVGHLDSNKDPLTALEGVAAAAARLPGLQLWCCFGNAPLLAPVRERLAADPDLARRVHLLGKVPHEQVQYLMRSADVFILGSHREGSGCSLIEALACGLPTVVTDIPSFRMLTGGGRTGALWPCGEAGRLCESLLAVAARPAAETRALVRQHFDDELSHAAVGGKMIAAYETLLQGKQAHIRRPQALDPLLPSPPGA